MKEKRTKNSREMTAVTLLNPKETYRKTAAGLKTASWFTQIAVCFTTGAGIFMWVQGLTLKYLPGWMPLAEGIAIALGLLAGYIAARITDTGFGDILERVLFTHFAKKHPSVARYNGATGDYFTEMQQWENYMLWGLLSILLAIDIASTVLITNPISERAGNEATVSVESLRTQLQQEHQREIASLQAIQKDKEKAVRAGRDRVEQGNPALARLKAEGNTWAASELEKKKARAIKTDEAARQKTEATIAAALDKGQAYISARVAEAEAENARKRESNADNQWIAAIMYLIFSVGLKLLTIYLRVQIVVTFCAYSYAYSPDITGDGIIDYRDLQAFGEKQSEGNFQ